MYLQFDITIPKQQQQNITIPHFFFFLLFYKDYGITIPLIRYNM